MLEDLHIRLRIGLDSAAAEVSCNSAEATNMTEPHSMGGVDITPFVVWEEAEALLLRLLASLLGQ